MKTIVIASLPLASALLWVIALLVDPGPYDGGAVFLIGLGLLSLVSIAIGGLALVGGRWARNTVYAAMAGTLLIAVVRPIDVIWVLSLIMSGLALIAVASPASGIRRIPTASTTVRRLPAATGPPQASVLLTVFLIGTPLLLGLAAWQGTSPATLIVGVTAPITAFWYSHVLPGGLVTIRYLWPSLAIGLGFLQEPFIAVASALLGLIAATLAHPASVKVAFHPPTEKGSAQAMLPEMVPGEVRESAEIDEKGRPR